MSAIVRKFEHSLGLPFLGIGIKTDLFQSCGHFWGFQICWHIECSTFTASSFRIWNSSTGIPSPPLALFVVITAIGLVNLGQGKEGERGRIQNEEKWLAYWWNFLLSDKCLWHSSKDRWYLYFTDDVFTDKYRWCLYFMTLKPTTGKQNILCDKYVEYYYCLQASLSPQKAELRYLTQPGHTRFLHRSQPEGTKLPRIQMTEGRREGEFYCWRLTPGHEKQSLSPDWRLGACS